MLLISIIIPSYNRAHLIGDTLNSILDQTYKSWECIIVDDGSTDNTLEILKAYQAKDERIHFYLRPEHRLQSANTCRNIGIEKSNGDFLQFLDSDDLLSPNKIKLQLQAILDTSDVAYGGYRYFKKIEDIEGAKKIPKPYYKNYNTGISFLEALGNSDSFVPPHAYLVRKSCVFKSGMWDETLKSNQDGEFFCRVLLKANYIKYVPDSEVYYRIHDAPRVSSLHTLNAFEERIRSWKIIQKHLKPYDLNNGLYIKSAKKILFRMIVIKHPKLILKNLIFFSQPLIFKLKNNRFTKRIL